MARLVRAGEFATEGERLAAETLSALPDDWVVICNKLLVTGDGRSFEIDFMVLGDQHVFVVEEKSWPGLIHGSDEIWVRPDGSSERSPLSKADYTARVLAGHLRARVPQLAQETEHFVTPCVVLTRADRCGVRDPRAADQVFLLARAVEKLRRLDQRGGVAGLGQLRGRLEHALMDLSDRPKHPRCIGLFSIQEALPGRPGCRLYRARLEESGEDRILAVYDLSGAATPAAREELKNFLLREFQAVRQLRALGIAPEVGDPFPWSDDALVIPIAPLVGKSLGALGPRQGAAGIEREIRLAAVAFRALALMHEHGIVHRAISPTTVYEVQGGQEPKVAFTGFHAACFGSQTIAPRLDALLSEDPYAAPELVAGYGAATPLSDVFSLGLVMLERIARVPLAALRSRPRGEVTLPDLAVCCPGLDADVGRDLLAIFESATATDASKRLQAAECAEFLADLERRLAVERQIREKRLLDNRYEVVRELGRGAMATTFLVRDVEFGGFFAAKRFHRPSEVRQQAREEFGVLRSITHPNLPRVFDVYPADKDIHVKLEYISGPTLEQLEDEFPWPLARWWRLAEDLLGALEVLEGKRLLHRDIKPANVILRQEDGRAVLIDFGFATSLGVQSGPAGTPLYLPPEALASTAPPPSGDRYAVALLLFRALVGRMPFQTNNGVYDQHRLLDVGTEVQPPLRPLTAVLLEALSPDPAGRPQSAAELKARLRTAGQSVDVADDRIAELEELVNPWVDQVRGLFRASSAGNADNRGLDSEFVRETYVPTALDTELLPRILARRPQAVFLSGNPGDGKTAFLERVRDELRRQGGQELRRDASGWEWDLAGHRFRACYDASEAHGELSADEQLAQKLAGLEGSEAPPPNLTVLVAINDGRLLDYFFTRQAGRYGWLADQLEMMLRIGSGENDPVWLVDLKRRAFVALQPGSDSPSVFQRVLDRLLDPVRWQVCDRCSARADCPIVRNAERLRGDIDGGEARRRLERLALVAHLRRERHITMRDLRSALAYLITGNLSCQLVHQARHDPSAPPFHHRRYWRSAFAPVDLGDELLAILQPLDPARFPQPRLDRFLNFHRAAAEAAPRQERANVDMAELDPSRFALEVEWMAEMKRCLYFEAASGEREHALEAPVVAWHDLLPYRHLDEFLRALASRAEDDRVCARLARGISRSDGIRGEVLDRGLCVRVAHSDAQQLTILKLFPLAEFELQRPDRGLMSLVEQIPDYLIFAHRSGTPRLEIPLDLFELLYRFADGLDPAAPELQPLLEDLAPFKSALLLRQAHDLVLVEGGRRVHQITQRGGKVVLLPTRSA